MPWPLFLSGGRHLVLEPQFLSSPLPLSRFCGCNSGRPVCHPSHHQIIEALPASCPRTVHAILATGRPKFVFVSDPPAAKYIAIAHPPSHANHALNVENIVPYCRETEL